MCVRLEVVGTEHNIVIEDKSSDISDILDRKYELSLLFDYYGDLLKESHREIFESYILDDMSLSEIAGEYGITRQGVHDSIKRTTKTLKEYENKLRLIEKSRRVNAYIDDIILKLEGTIDDGDNRNIRGLLEQISKEV